MKRFITCLIVSIIMLSGNSVLAEEEDKISENPSNPLAAASNVDLLAKYFDLKDGSDRYIYSLEGATMLHPKIKLKYELFYWDTDVTGSNENDWETFVIRPIFFIKEGKTEAFKYRVAVGLDWTYDFDNEDKGIGGGSSTIAPFVGLAMGITEQTTLIPLVQHFMSYDGNDVNQTAFRLIGMHALPQHKMWLKLDAKVPVDWQNDEEIPATAELQWGKMFTQKYGAFIDGLVGVGGDRPYDYGVGLGVRVMF